VQTVSSSSTTPEPVRGATSSPVRSRGSGVVLTASRQHSLDLFLVGFTALFALTGIGNGSTYKMIPAIFKATRPT
jgi:nitrate/nitrite transporter NarK